jgi:hypothetical protein
MPPVPRFEPEHASARPTGSAPTALAMARAERLGFCIWPSGIVPFRHVGLRIIRNVLVDSFNIVPDLDADVCGVLTLRSRLPSARVYRQHHWQSKATDKVAF